MFIRVKSLQKKQKQFKTYNYIERKKIFNIKLIFNIKTFQIVFKINEHNQYIENRDAGDDDDGDDDKDEHFSFKLFIQKTRKTRQLQKFQFL